MSDLIINLELLHQLRDDLDAVVSEFTNADDFSSDVATATGHDNLGSHVEDFAHKWNDKRKSMTEAVEALRKKIEGITDGFTQVDDGLAQALTDAAAQPLPATLSGSSGGGGGGGGGGGR